MLSPRWLQRPFCIPPPKKYSLDSPGGAPCSPAGRAATSRASVCQLLVEFHASGAASCATTAPPTSRVSSAGAFCTRATTALAGEVTS